MQDARADVIVIGAGVIGLACARGLASRANVLVIERHPRPGREGSGRNSGVLHAGVHHPAGWAKAELCVRGRALLVEHCERARVPHRLVGKLVVARGEAERAVLEGIAARAAERGVAHRMVGAEEARRIEPAIECDAALHVPSSGVVATPALIGSLERDAIERGARLAYGQEVVAVEREPAGWIVETPALRARAERIVIAAGLDADRIATQAGIDVGVLGGPHRVCAGRWMTLAPRWRGSIRGLVYPIPGADGLGVHLTVDLEGGVRAGPDTLWIERGSEVSAPDAAAFAAALAPWLAGIEARDLAPACHGLRPKLHGPGGQADFVVRDGGELGAPGAIVLLGIESPGLTACLAIAERVAALALGSACYSAA